MSHEVQKYHFLLLSILYSDQSFDREKIIKMVLARRSTVLPKMMQDAAQILALKAHLNTSKRYNTSLGPYQRSNVPKRATKASNPKAAKK